MPDAGIPRGIRSGHIGRARPEPAPEPVGARPEVPAPEVEPGAGLASEVLSEPDPEPEGAPHADDEPGHDAPADEPASAWNVDALFEQLGEAAPAVLEHVVNAARELMRAAKAVVDAAEGAMEGAMEVARAGDGTTPPSPSAPPGPVPGTGGPPTGSGPSGPPGSKPVQRIDVD